MRSRGKRRRLRGPSRCRASARRPFLAAAAGVFLALDLICWHHSIEDLGAGLATVLGNLQIVFLPLIAWVVLSERPGRRMLVTLPLALIGVLLISGVFEHGAYGRDPSAGGLFGLLTGVTYSICLLLLRAGSRGPRNTAEPLFLATLTATASAILIGLALGEAQLVPSWPSAGWLVTLALGSQVLGWLLITRALPLLPAAVTSIVLTHPADRLDVPGGAHLRRAAERAAVARAAADPLGPAEHRSARSRPHEVARRRDLR